MRNCLTLLTRRQNMFSGVRDVGCRENIKRNIMLGLENKFLTQNLITTIPCKNS